MLYKNGWASLRQWTGIEARRFAPKQRKPSTRNFHESKAAIRAQLRGSNTATALGLTSRSSTPVLSLCHKLLAAGHDPTWPLAAYRGDVLCLYVRSIGEAAELRMGVSRSGTPIFKRQDGRPAAPPMRSKQRGAS